MAETKITEQELSSTLLSGWVPISNSWEYAGNDAPTYAVTVPSGATSLYSPGMRVKLTQPTDGVKYFIITAVFSSSIYLYGGTDYDLDDEAITDIYYSTQKAPFGFPLDPDKWTVEISRNTNDPVADTTSTDWQNITSINIPIGLWYTILSAALFVVDDNSADFIQTFMTLSKANNSEDDLDFSSTYHIRATQSSSYGIRDCHNSYRSKILNLSTKDTYYLNLKTAFNLGAGGTLQLEGTQSNTIIRAISAYL